MDVADFVALETQVWESLRRGDAAADRALLTEDFVGVYPSGFAGRDDHTGQLDGGPTVHDYSIDEARLLVLSEDHALLSYRAVSRRSADAVPETQYVSSLWSRRGDRWLNVFSQDTPG